ncbi:hypothetical protein [Roseateles microcysteis]|uniref:hypothetical protein n=1 Tax=Roseateles microcysteis TaxID=3119057 RepID=UPI002FE57E42
MVSPALGAAGFVLTGMGAAIQSLYGIAKDLNDYFDELIDKMKASDNLMIERTGRVLEGVKYGFGIGYLSSVIVVAVGQLLLGNQLAAAATVATAAVAANPIAMTCAAFGAIYYGWAALSDEERNDILKRVCDGLQVGAELIKAVIAFVLNSAKDLLNSSILKDLASTVSAAASQFGKTLAEIAHLTKAMMAKASRNAESAAGAPSQPQNAQLGPDRQPTQLLRDLIEADRTSRELPGHTA